MSYEYHIRFKNNCSMKVEGKDQKELFWEIAAAHEIFGEEVCGLCGSHEIKPVVRIAGEDRTEFPEMHCQKCGAKLLFGLNQKGGGMFPHRKLTDEGKPDRINGKYGKHCGWTKFRGNKPGGEAVPEKK